MNITPIAFYATNRIKDSKINRDKQIINRTLSQDIVCFSGKVKKSSKNIQSYDKNGAQFGMEIYSMLNDGFDSQEILKRLNEKNPNLTIKDIDALKEFYINPEAYRAYFLSFLRDGFEPKNMHLFLSLNDNFNINEDKLLFAMDAAHEYTHYSQTIAGDFYEDLKKISNNDSQYAGVITALGDFVFTVFDIDLNAEFTNYVFKDGKFNSNQQPIPKQAYINKQEMLNKAGFKNEVEFKKYINAMFHRQYLDMIKTIIERPELADDGVLGVLNKVSQNQKSVEKLFSDIKKYCVIQAAREKEARSAESILAKKILKTSGAINYDVYLTYYEMLENALK